MTSDQQLQAVSAYVALGSNIGNRETYLQQAIDALNHYPGIEVMACSSIYETEPVGYLEQAPFLNMVIALVTRLPAQQLLKVMLEIEQQLGRTRDVRWGPRTIDLDMLLYGREQMESPELIIPHPRMYERAFVLIPLAEVLNKQNLSLESVLDKLMNLDGREGVILWKKVQ
jgi:2-amino-4-hydroxy-6-hydroxymethyldihydropteridine diphosphokinase